MFITISSQECYILRAILLLTHIHFCYKIILVYEVILENKLVLHNGSLAQQRQNTPSVLLKDKSSEKGHFLTKYKNITDQNSSSDQNPESFLGHEVEDSQ